MINKRYTFPRHFPVKLMQSETLWLNIEVFSMAFVREIGRNGVLYSGTRKICQLIESIKSHINDITNYTDSSCFRQKMMRMMVEPRHSLPRRARQRRTSSRQPSTSQPQTSFPTSHLRMLLILCYWAWFVEHFTISFDRNCIMHRLLLFVDLRVKFIEGMNPGFLILVVSALYQILDSLYCKSMVVKSNF